MTDVKGNHKLSVGFCRDFGLSKGKERIGIIRRGSERTFTVECLRNLSRTEK